MSVNCSDSRACIAVPRNSLISINNLPITIFDPAPSGCTNTGTQINVILSMTHTPIILAQLPALPYVINCDERACPIAYSREIVPFWLDIVNTCPPQGLISYDPSCCCMNAMGTLYSQLSTALTPFVWYTLYVLDSDLSRTTFFNNTCLDLNGPITPVPTDPANFNLSMTATDPNHILTPIPPETYLLNVRGQDNTCIAVLNFKGYRISSLQGPLMLCDDFQVSQIGLAIASIECICYGRQGEPPPPPPSTDIFNTKEDYEVLKGLWIGRYAYEEYKDAHIIKRAKVIDKL